MKGYIFTYLLVVVGSIGAFRHPRIGLYVYILFAVLRPQAMWAFAGNMSDLSMILGVAMIAGWALKGMGGFGSGRGRLAIAMLTLYTVWAGLSTFQALNTQVAWVQWREHLKIFMPFLVGVTVLRTRQEAITLLWIIVGAQGYVSYEMNRAYLDGFNFVRELGYGGMDNNCFGVSLVATIGPAVALGLSAKGWKARMVAGACCLLILHTTLLTYSRGAMLGLVVTLLVAFLLIPKRPLYLVGMLIFALIAVRFTGPQLVERYRSAFAEKTERDASAESRVDLWRDCLAVAAANPVFGIGPNNWPLVAADYGWTRGKSAHSAWMQIVAELGYPGLAFLLLFYLAVTVALWPLIRARKILGPGPPLLATGIITSIAGYAVAAQFVSLQGLEIPYYVALAAIVYLKDTSPTTAVAAVPVRQVVVPGSLIQPRTAVPAPTRG